MINTEEAVVLAEIFVLRLENQLRAEKDAVQAKKPRVVPIPDDLSPFKISDPADLLTK